MRDPITLVQLNRRITGALTATPGLTDVWITAETSDLRTSGGHCYMELLQKDDSGRMLAKSRAVIWASAYARLGAAFYATTGSRLASDMKIMARVSVNFHAVYGFTLVITDIDPDYTVGDLARRRNRIIAQLKEDGVYDLNRTMHWSSTPCRIAVISAAGAAGYGDFVKHLHHNAARLRFTTRLFTAALQGAQTAPSVIAALDSIMAEVDSFDCVVIIRGGGAVSDLVSFDDYDLASNVAQFPLPIIVGIGHERDVTVLDFVANTRVKTPTAAAEVLIGRMSEAYENIRRLARAIMGTVAERIASERQQLAYWDGNLPALARNVIDRARRRVGPETARAFAAAVRSQLARRSERLGSLGELLDALAPEATLRRGYSITHYAGRAVTDSSTLTPGAEITTTFAAGPEVKSVIQSENIQP